MRQAAPILADVKWEVDDAAPTWVKSEPLPSDMEATRVWREEPSAVRAAEIRDFARAELEPTLVFPLERRLQPRAQGNFGVAFAAFAVTAVLFALALPWVLSHLP